MANKVVHFEIPFDDADRAHTFYEQAFGWALTDMPDPAYTIAGTGPVGPDQMPTEPGYINGGMFKRAAGAPDTPVITVDVPDIDKALASIESLGGKTTVPRTAIPGMGAYAYFTDPEGNVLGLWETTTS